MAGGRLVMDFHAFAAAGPLWLALESLLESLPFGVRVAGGVLLVALAVLGIAALVAFAASSKRRK